MKKFKKVMAMGALFVTICGLSTPVFADTNPNVSVTETRREGTIKLNNIKLIEDNGQSYVEIVIPAHKDNSSSRAKRSASGSGSYSTTYDMTGGVFTQTSWECSSAPTFSVTVNPTSYAGDSGGEMSVYLQRKDGWGWVESDWDQISLTRMETITLKGPQAGTYRLYFRNFTGMRAKGDIDIYYTY